MNTVLYADDRILMATSEDLQTMAHHLNLIENIKWPYLVQKQNQWQCGGTT